MLKEQFDNAIHLDERTDMRNMSPLHLVCAGHAHQQKERVIYLLDACGDDEAKRRALLGHVTRNGFTALHIAIYKVYRLETSNLIVVSV
jgi:hypothetical protein